MSTGSAAATLVDIGAASLEHWNYTDAGKDFHGGYCFLSQGPLPRGWARTLTAARGHWGLTLRSEMMLYNRMAGLRMVAHGTYQTCGSAMYPCFRQAAA